MARLLSAVALFTALAGAIGAVGLMLRAGQRIGSPPVLLLVLFAGWVLAPFIGFVLANVLSKRWSVLTQATLYGVTLVLTLGTLAIYADVAFGPATSQVVPVFVAVPPVSILIALVALVAALITGRLSRRADAA